MNRRDFLCNTTTIGVASCLSPSFLFNPKESLMPYKDLVIGHNSHQYKIDLNWGALNDAFYPVNDCHEMVQDSKGRIILLTNETKNNIIVYDKSGHLIEECREDLSD